MAIEIQPTNINKENDTISFKELIIKIRSLVKYLLSKWLIIIGFSFIGSILGFTYSYLRKPIYYAITTFVLESGEGGTGLSQYAGIASMMGLDLGSGGGGLFQGDNIIELYKSRAMIEKTLLSEVKFNNKKQLLIRRYIEANTLDEKWANKPELKNVKFSGKIKNNLRIRDSLLREFANDINKNYLRVSKPDKKLNIIEVSVKSEDEFFAKMFNDQIVKNVNDFYIQTKTKKSLENIRILQQKTDSVRAVMNGALISAVRISDATPNLNPTREIQRVAPMQRSQFNAETNKAILQELVKNLEMSKMALLKETPLIQVVDVPIYPLVKDRVGRLKGLIMGGIFAGFLVVVILIMRRLLKSIMM